MCCVCVCQGVRVVHTCRIHSTTHFLFPCCMCLSPLVILFDALTYTFPPSPTPCIHLLLSIRSLFIYYPAPSPSAPTSSLPRSQIPVSLFPAQHNARPDQLMLTSVVCAGQRESIPLMSRADATSSRHRYALILDNGWHDELRPRPASPSLRTSPPYSYPY